MHSSACMPTCCPLPDQGARERALDPERSFLVQAPAGSGKTGLLIQRYLLLLARVGAPEEIVAITFTKKAASEMRERVLTALDAARKGRAAADEHEARTFDLALEAVALDERHGWRIAENPARLRILTIDALCTGLVRQMPVLSRLGAQPQFIEDASEFYREAARATVDLIGSGDAAADPVARLLRHLDNDCNALEALLAEMLERRDQWLRSTSRLPRRQQLEAPLAAERARRVAAARALYPGALPGDAEAWKALATSLLRQSGEWRKKSPEAQLLCENEPLRAALAAFLDMPPERYSDSQWEVLGAMSELVRCAAAQLRLVFRARGQVDFTEVAWAALRALGEESAPTELALALDYRIRHLLVDEFQDTSITQYELLAKLTAGWEPGDGRTLFAVGDPMQSIYRFREAEVGEFLRTWESGHLASVGVERVRLTANFRSQAGIVEWVNDAFRQVMPTAVEAASGAVPHTPSIAQRGRRAHESVTVHPFFDRDEDGEASRVVELIAQARQEDARKTIAILVRTRLHLRAILPRLRQAGIGFSAIEIESLDRRPVVQDLLALTRALTHLGDRLAWLAVLRAPWCGLTLTDLTTLVEGQEVKTVWELVNDAERVVRLTGDGQARLAQLRQAIGPVIGARLRRRLRDQIEGAWLALGGPACVADATGLEDAEAYFTALEDADDAGALVDPDAFQLRLEKLWALPNANAGENPVQIMTIHKAKGLEFDHVIIPGLDRWLRPDDKRLFLWIERPAAGGTDDATELLVAPIEETGAKDDSIYSWLKKLDGERASHEAARLLYVATTRARERLHLLGTTELERSTAPASVRSPNKHSLLAKLWPVVGDRFIQAAAMASTDDNSAGASARMRPRYDQDLVRLPSDRCCPPPPRAVEWQAATAEPRAQDEIEYSWVGETARHIGSVVHRWLQRIADDMLVGWDESRVAGIRNAVRTELAARGVRESEVDFAVERVLTALSRAIHDEHGRWLLGPHRFAVSEHRITTMWNGVITRMVIDRLFEDASGARWIVDYKTSTHEGADVATFLDRERERYTAQIARYARAMGDVDRLGLYFPLLGGWREI
jgi:ATP-dependent helicase/nuclease subunit A